MEALLSSICLGLRREWVPLLEMKDEYKTKKHLIEELARLRQRLAELEGRAAQAPPLHIAKAQSETKYSALVEGSRDGMVIVQDGVHKYANRAMCDISGYTIDEIVGMAFLNMVAPECRALVAARVRLDKAEKELPGFYESRIKCKNGSVKDVQLATGVGTYDGRIANIAIVRDITENKLAEEAVRESEERFRTICTESPIAIELFDADGQLLEANRACLDIFAVPGFEQLQGFNLFSDPNVTDRVRQSLLEGKTVRYEVLFDLDTFREKRLYEPTRSGAIYIDAIITPLVGQNKGRPKGYLVQMQDITERKLAEHALRESEERFRSFFTESPIAIEIFDAQGRLVDANRACLDIFGVGSIGEIRDYNLFGFGGVAGEVENQLRCGESVRYEVPFDLDEFRKNKAYMPRRSGSIHLDALITPLCMAGVLPPGSYLVQMQDMTDRKRAEQALRDLSSQLADVQEAERRHIARELHDQVGQSLTGLKLLIEMAARSGISDSALILGRAQSLLNEVMIRVGDMSLNLRPPMLDDLGLLSTLEWHFESYAGQTGVDVEFESHGMQRRLPTEVETAAYRIVQEGLTNVARHADVKKASVTLSTNRGRLVIRIDDQGSGFDPDTVWRSGTSSGLIGMRERAVALEGSLSVHSTPGHGTTIVAELPIRSAEPTKIREEGVSSV